MICKICGIETARSQDRRCRLCRLAKTATDMGTSYGKLQSSIWLRYGDQIRASADLMSICPTCRKLFLPRSQSQLYCSNACAVKAAQKAYRKRKRAQASRAPVDNRKESTCSSSEESTGERSTPKPSTLGEADTTVILNGKGKTD